MIGILDYGAGNLRSVENALAQVGAEVEVIRAAASLERADKIIFPGVGNFGPMMAALDEQQLREPLLKKIQSGIPLLGICLGLQALFAGSEEAPEVRGLAFFPETVRRFPLNARVPRMGWDRVQAVKPSRLLAREIDSWFYFAHSYFAPAAEATSATCDYLTPFTAVLEAANIYGVQFHPEKSGDAGLALLRRFVEL